jgi:histidyl-tRNA synthetase
MIKPLTTPARGMRDFLPEDVRKRSYVIGVIRDVYERHGFEPLETPAVENIETLLGKYGEEGDRLIFKILKRGEEGRQTGDADLALRYDLTVPLARVVAEYHGTLPKFFKRYQIQPVWRADRPQKGRFREFYQCDVDAIGSTSPVIEAEVCGAVSDVLERLGFTDFVIRLNHRELLRALLDVSGVPANLHDSALIAVDKLDKVDADGVVAELERRGVSAEAATRTLQAFGHSTTKAAAPQAAESSVAQAFRPADVDAQLERLLAGHDVGARALDNLRAVMRAAAATSAGAHLRLDPSLARGLSYYTGAIFEIAVPDLAGSLGGGGRYDNLVGMFLGQPVAACGFSLGLERIFVVMTERGMFPADVTASGADVLVTLWNGETIGTSLTIARQLRAAGLRVEVYPEADKIGKQLKYASSRHARYAVIAGDDERAKGTVMVKHLTSGEQTEVPQADLARWFDARPS